MAKVILDAGHGGADPGAVYEGRQEKDDNLRLALAVGEILENQGTEVVYTRTEDVYDTPLQKAQIANREGGDFFVSFHRNSSPEPNQYSGVETLVYDLSGEKLKLAEAINEELAGVGFRNLGVKERPGLIVLRRTEMPAVLVETGFLNTEADNLLFDEEFNQIAQAIADGILQTLEAEGEQTDAGYRADKGLSVPDAGQGTGDGARSGADSGLSVSDAGQGTGSSARSGADSGLSVSDTGQGTDSRARRESDSRTNVQYSGLQATENWKSAENGVSQVTQSGENVGNSVSQVTQSGEKTQCSRSQETKNDGAAWEQPEDENADAARSEPRIYRVQTGAFRNCANAQDQLYGLQREGFPSYILLEDGYYRVQTGAYLRLDNAVRMEEALRKKGYSTFIVS